MAKNYCDTQEDEIFYNLRVTEKQVNKMMEELEYIKNLQGTNVEEIQYLISEIKEQYEVQQSAFSVYFGKK